MDFLLKIKRKFTEKNGKFTERGGKFTESMGRFMEDGRGEETRGAEVCR